MKKILCVLLIFLLIFTFSCKKTNTDDNNDNNGEQNTNNETPYEFIDKEEAKKKLKKFRIYITILNGDVTSTIEYMENDQYAYLGDTNKEILYDKEANIFYSINSGTKTKEQISAGTYTLDSLKDLFYTVIYAHYGITTEYEKSSTTYEGTKVDKYSKSVKIDNYSYDEYYLVDSTNGICMVHYLSANVNGKEEKIDIHTSLSFDETFISLELNEYVSYEETSATHYFTSWPNNELGKKLPELRSGTFRVAYEQDGETYIYKDQLVTADLTSYFSKLSSYNFTNPYQLVDEEGNISYFNYTVDKVVVLIEFNKEYGSATIRIKVCEDDEIQDYITRYSK